NKDKYLILFLITKNYLQIPATLAFSKRALIINKLKNRLIKDTFEKIICFKSW
ncbi:hypothetical protein DL98DRAFT_357617, partial [Cadophora sp. DSE1049]